MLNIKNFHMLYLFSFRVVVFIDLTNPQVNTACENIKYHIANSVWRIFTLTPFFNRSYLYYRLTWGRQTANRKRIQMQIKKNTNKKEADDKWIYVYTMQKSPTQVQNDITYHAKFQVKRLCFYTLIYIIMICYCFVDMWYMFECQ